MHTNKPATPVTRFSLKSAFPHVTRKPYKPKPRLPLDFLPIGESNCAPHKNIIPLAKSPSTGWEKRNRPVYHGFRHPKNQASIWNRPLPPATTRKDLFRPQFEDKNYADECYNRHQMTSRNITTKTVVAGPMPKRRSLNAPFRHSNAK